MVGLTTVLTVSPWDGQSDASLPIEPIKILSTEHKINFPNEVVLTVEAESQSEITEVTLYYKLGDRAIKVYGYPDFEQGNRVLADFVINTDGRSFLPSGVDIEYQYRIKDVEGNIFQSPYFSLEYKNPAYQWRRYRQGMIEILWHDRPRHTVIALTNTAITRLELLKGLLGMTDVEPMKAVIVNSSREARHSFPMVSHAATTGHLYRGFAFGDLNVFVLRGLDVDGVVHETAHLLIDEALSSPRARIPSWLNEGLAMYFESGPRGRDTTAVRAARHDALIPLRNMNRNPGRPDEVRLFYAQSWSLVNYMMTVHGEQRMAELLAAIAKGDPIREAIIEVYGISLEGLEEWWKAGLPTVSTSTPDTGIERMSALITGVVATAIAIVSTVWVRNSIRHDQNPTA